MTTGNFHNLGLANKLHINKDDFLPKVWHEDVMSTLVDICQDIASKSDQKCSKTLKDNVRFLLKYVIEFDKEFCLTVPTTCAYQDVLMNNSCILIQFFSMLGLGCCIFLRDYTLDKIFMQPAFPTIQLSLLLLMMTVKFGWQIKSLLVTCLFVTICHLKDKWLCIYCLISLYLSNIFMDKIINMIHPNSVKFVHCL